MDGVTILQTIPQYVPSWGWSAEAAQNMCSIEKEITKRMKEIYALCLMGLGENTTKDTFYKDV